jgi:hypothetical protein
MTENRKEVQLNMSFMELVQLLAEGNPGAVTVMLELLSRDKNFGFMTLLSLDDMNIRGTQIWIAFKDYCNQDYAKLENAIKTRDPLMIEKINAEGKLGNHPHRAIHSGASQPGKRARLFFSK